MQTKDKSRDFHRQRKNRRLRTIFSFCSASISRILSKLALWRNIYLGPISLPGSSGTPPCGGTALHRGKSFAVAPRALPHGLARNPPAGGFRAPHSFVRGVSVRISSGILADPRDRRYLLPSCFLAKAGVRTFLTLIISYDFDSAHSSDAELVQYVTFYKF